MKKKILISSIVVLLIASVGIISVIALNSSKKDDVKKPEKKAYEALLNNESPYTLDEIYKMIEDPQIIEHLKKPVGEVEDGTAYSVPIEFYYVITHFYNFFSKSTPFKIVTKLKSNEGNYKEIIELYEFSYINYDEYMKEMKDFYYREEEERKKQENSGESQPLVRSLGYSEYEWQVRWLLYGKGLDNEGKLK